MSVVAGIDLGGTAINYTFLRGSPGKEVWLIESLCEHPARSKEGPDVCLQQIADGLEVAAATAAIRTSDIVFIGLDTPGPASSAGVSSAIEPRRAKRPHAGPNARSGTGFRVCRG